MIGSIKKAASVFLASTMILGICASAYGQESVNNKAYESGDIKFDFSSNDCGFVPIFADYPAEKDAEKFYELDFGWKEIPVDKAGKGLFISGNNHSDDLFMGYYKELDGFTPNKTYTADISFELATNVDGGMIGIGGSPGASVYVKCGIVSQKPAAVIADLNYYRLNIDKGNQGTDGKDMKTVGTIEKQETLLADKYEINKYSLASEITSDKDGKAYLIIGTDSGFEGSTAYYINSAEVNWTEKATASTDERFESDIKEAISADIIEDGEYARDNDISRLQFCEFVYNMVNPIKEFPTAKLARNPFDDTNSFKINVLAFSGIVSGKSENVFAPDDKITREEAAVVLCRAASYAGLDMPAVKPNITYADNGEIADWAAPSVYSLRVMNIIENRSGDEFKPKADITFDEAVAYLMNLYRLIKK